MKKVKFILSVLVSALYTSGWWAWATLPNAQGLFPPLIVVSLFIVVGAFAYCGIHWDDS